MSRTTGRRAFQDVTAIAGIGQTEFAKELPMTEVEMAAIAINAALEDAGVAPDEVDALCSFTMEPLVEIEVARNVGLGDVTCFSQIGYGGGGGCATVGHAAMAVATGQARAAVAWRSRKRGAATSRPWAQVPRGVPGPQQFTRPFGLLRPVDEIALLARRYMHEYGATRDHLANVALAFRRHANANPNAVMRDRSLTREDYFAARWISEPLSLYDNCLETDGALAVVVVPAERAGDLRHPPVLIHAFAQGFDSGHEQMTNYYTADPLIGPGWACARALWERAEFGPDDVDAAQIYDAFTPLVLLSLEAYGFCKRGEAGPLSDDGGLEVGGRLPTNTSGGGLSEAYVHGYNLIVEGVRQLRGTSPNQVPGARTCLVTSGEGVPTSALLLRT